MLHSEDIIGPVGQTCPQKVYPSTTAAAAAEAEEERRIERRKKSKIFILISLSPSSLCV